MNVRSVFRAAVRDGMIAFAGLRLGEAAARQVTDVDFLRREIHVRRQVQRVNGGEVEIPLPKCNSERTVRDVVAVQRALGHAKSTTTLTTYAHLWPSAESRVRAGLLADYLRTGNVNRSDQRPGRSTTQGVLGPPRAWEKG